jgi:UDP-N-acetylmuramoyl-L-alanine---L-glutamate ligase
MRAADLVRGRVAIWGCGREGRAALGFLNKHHPGLRLVLFDDDAGQAAPAGIGNDIECVFGAAAIARAIDTVDVIVKSPGVSLYRPELQDARRRGVTVTSLLNLWFAERYDLTTICVTGTKGKSTTASLIGHILAQLGRRTALVGNIGVPITEIDRSKADIAVIEVSSYQAADFDGTCDVAVLTSLYPEHIDWHLSVENYFRDKINLLKHGRCRVINHEAVKTVERLVGSLAPQLAFNDESGFHFRGRQIWDDRKLIGEIGNPYLNRPHNRSNLCAALAAASSLGIDSAAALDATSGFRGLPHRQQELGEVAGVLFVDDSISTIPEATMAALAVYASRPVSVILGGHDRGVDYHKLVKTLTEGAARAVICLGDAGRRIYRLARTINHRCCEQACALYEAQAMEDAVSLARRVTPPGGVILLSPAAPSYGQYRNYIERGHDFAAKAGLLPSADANYSDLQ